MEWLAWRKFIENENTSPGPQKGPLRDPDRQAIDFPQAMLDVFGFFYM